MRFTLGALATVLVLALTGAAQAVPMYVSSSGTNEILKYDGTTGAYQGVLCNVAAQGLSGLKKIEVAPDGRLVVMVDQGIVRYNPTTGAYIDQVYAGAMQTHAMAIAPDGRIFVSGTLAGTSVDVINPVTGARTLFGSGYGDALGAQGLVIGPQGDVYAYGDISGANRVWRYDINTGAVIANPPSTVTWHSSMNNSWTSDLTYANGYIYWENQVNVGEQSVRRSGDPLPYVVTNELVDGYVGTVSGRLEILETGPDNNVYWTYDDSSVAGLVGIKMYNTTTGVITTLVTSGGELVNPQGIAWVPEPATLSLLVLGGLGMLVRRRR